MTAWESFSDVVHVVYVLYPVYAIQLTQATEKNEKGFSDGFAVSQNDITNR